MKTKEYEMMADAESKRERKNQEQVVVNATGYPGFQLTL